MDILIDTNSIRAKATELERLMKELDRKNDSLDKIKKQLDYEVKCKSNISNSISNIKMRISMVEDRIGKINYLLLFAASSYENAEKSLINLTKEFEENLKSLGFLFVSVYGKSENSIGKNKKDEKWYTSKWFKIAVGGAVVVGAAVAVVVTGGSAMAIGAAVGAGAMGTAKGIISGIKSEKDGKDFMDGFADGFMKGAISGAITGAFIGKGVGTTLAKRAAQKAASNTAAEMAAEVGTETTVKTAAGSISKIKPAFKKKIIDSGKNVLKDSIKSGAEEALKSDDSGLEVADDFLKGAGKGAKNSTSKLVKDVLKGKAGNNEATDILIDGGAAVVEEGIDSIIKGEKLTAGEALETFENGINDSAKGKMKESIFGESIDKKGEIIVDLSFNEENTKIIDGISERINKMNNKDSNSWDSGGSLEWSE